MIANGVTPVAALGWTVHDDGDDDMIKTLIHKNVYSYCFKNIFQLDLVCFELL